MRIGVPNFSSSATSTQNLKSSFQYKKNDNNDPTIDKENKAFNKGLLGGFITAIGLCFADYAINYFTNKKLNLQATKEAKETTKIYVPFISLIKELLSCI